MVYMYSHCIFKGSTLLCVYFTVEELERGIQDAIILEADEAKLHRKSLMILHKMVSYLHTINSQACTQFSYTNTVVWFQN